MNNAPLDENGRQGAIAALNTDGKTITPIKFNPTFHGMKTVDGTGQANNGNHGGNALVDENGRQSLYGLSSTDGVTRVLIYTNSSGAVLTQST